MGKATARRWEIAILKMVELIGLKRVIEQIGVERIVHHLGIKRILTHMTLHEMLNAYGIERFVAELTPEEKDVLRRVLQVPRAPAKNRAGRPSAEKRPARNASPPAAK